MTCHYLFLDTHCQHNLMLKLAENKHCCEGLANVYTDGSFFGDYSGLGVYIEECINGKNFKKHFYQQKCFGSKEVLVQHERNAVLLAINLCLSLHIQKMNLIIDNHIVFEELLNENSDLRQVIDQNFTVCRVFLVFSHIGIRGNEFADRLANSAKYLDKPNTLYSNRSLISSKLSGLLRRGVIARKQLLVTEKIVPHHQKFNFA